MPRPRVGGDPGRGLARRRPRLEGAGGVTTGTAPPSTSV
jgi:hypothetical protein